MDPKIPRERPEREWQRRERHEPPATEPEHSPPPAPTEDPYDGEFVDDEPKDQ
jgi:hypothetical protein